MKITYDVFELNEYKQFAEAVNRLAGLKRKFHVVVSTNPDGTPSMFTIWHY